MGICSACIFLRRREPGAGDEVEADISQPGGAEISDQRANAPHLCASGDFGSGYAGYLHCEIDHIWKDFQTASLLNLSVSASLAAGSAVTAVRSLECNIGQSALKSQIGAWFEPFAFELFVR